MQLTHCCLRTLTQAIPAEEQSKFNIAEVSGGVMGPGHDAFPSMYPVNMEMGPAMMGMGSPAIGMASIP